MLSEPFVSVIIPTYNRKETLNRAMASVVNQTYKNIEMIVVDDGSSDDSIELHKTYPQTKWISQKNAGVSAARNRGVFESRGEWLAFLDSDDEWSLQKLQKQIDFIQRNTSCAFVHCDELWIRNGVRVNAPLKYRKAGGWQFLRCAEICCVGASTVMLRRDFFQSLGGFREDLPICEDYHLWLKVSAICELGYVDEPLTTKYAGHGDQLSLREPAMDYYRLKALDDVLIHQNLRTEWKIAAQSLVAKKSKILLNGYVKHQNMQHFAEVSAIRDRWS